MTTGITGPGSRPNVPGLPADAPTAVAQRLHAGQQAEDALVANGLRELGMDVPPRRHALGQVDMQAEIEHAVSMPARRHTYVPVGTIVSTGPTESQSWAVVGAKENGTLHLARRSADGTSTVQATFGWSALVTRSPELLDQPIRDARGVDWIPYSFDGVEQAGRAGIVQLASIDELMVAGLSGREPTTVATTWGDVIDAVGLDQRVPGVDMPYTEYDAMAVRAAVGDHRLVASDVGLPHGKRSVLVGTDGSPRLGADVLRDADEMQRWYRAKLGLDVWGAGDQVVIRTDKQEFLANAAAAAIGEDAYLFEGPRDQRIRGAWLTQLSGEYGRAVRSTNELIQEHDQAVRAHEATHVGVRREWGTQVDRIPQGTPMAAVLEDAIVEEALGDLAGASKSGKPSVGIRVLDRMANGYGDYNQLKALMAATPADEFDVHLGTQLLTAPMVEVQATYGDDVVAELTGAAIRNIGHRIAIGELTSVDIPTAAIAIRDAAGWRYGMDSELVVGLDQAWSSLLNAVRTAR